MADLPSITIDTLRIKLKSLNYPIENCVITNDTLYRPGYDKKNIIFIVPFLPDSKRLYDFNAILRRGCLPILHNDDFFTKPDHYLLNGSQDKYSTLFQNFNQEFRYLYYWEKTDPMALINSRFSNRLENFLHVSIENNLIFWNNIDKIHSLTDKINYTHPDPEANSDIKTDLSILETYNILTSRLAVLIYRVAMLNPLETTTQAGRYFHKQLGSKSKTFNKLKLLGNKQKRNNPQRQNEYNFKGYDLSVNEAEAAIKKEIAKALLSFLNNNKKLDIDAVAKVTKLPLEEVKKL